MPAFWLLLIPLGIGLAYWGSTTTTVSRANPPAPPAPQPAPPQVVHAATPIQQAVLDATRPGPSPTTFTNVSSGVTQSTSGAQTTFENVEVPNGGGDFAVAALAAFDASQGKTDDNS